MKSKAYVPKETSIYVRYLFQDKGLRGDELLKRFPKYSKATIYRHAKRPIDKVATFDKRKHNKGRPRKLSIREARSIMRQLRICRTTLMSFSASRLRAVAGISPDIYLWCIRKTLNRHGYRYLHPRKKGLTTRKDVVRRYRFACKIRRLLPMNFWERGISSYFDGTSFLHKTNPFDQARATQSLAWRRKSEGVALNCTTKGKKAGVEGRTVHFFVASLMEKEGCSAINISTV